MTPRPSRRRRRIATLAVAASLALLVPATTGAPAQAQQNDEPMPWLNSHLGPQQRADLLLGAMSADQKIHMLHGASSLIGTRVVNPDDPPSIGYIPAIPELRVPAFVMTDGPSGLRNTERATVMPAPISQAAAFDPEVARRYGATIGREARQRGQDLIFGPGLNIARNPQAGRTFEYFGEDPYLAGMTAAANVKGVQGAGTMATVKHYVANNQETNRTLSSSNIAERPLHEIYEKGFRIAVKDSDPAAVMCAYNKVNNVPACGNEETLEKDLRDEMGFRGLVVTDYPAAWSPTDVAHGLNVELPWSFWTSPSKIRSAIAKGSMSWADVDQRVRETLVQMFRFGLFDHPWDSQRRDRVRGIVELDAGRGFDEAREAAERGAVLLTNDGTLPLAASGGQAPRRLLVVGQGARSTPAGGGSSSGKALKSDNTLDALTRALPDTTVVWKASTDLIGISTEAEKSDAVVVVASSLATELIDRPNLNFSSVTNRAVELAAKHNDRTIVVTQIGGPTLMPWKDDVAAILNVWYPGEAGGLATARLLTGRANPSGRLPQTFPDSNSQFPANTPRQFPGADLGFQSYYDEGVMVGYRWYTSNGRTPQFPFGHGLSYTTFRQSNHRIVPTNDGFDVRMTVTNTGNRTGRTTAQVYLRKPGGSMPARELGGFATVELAPGSSREITVHVPAGQLEHWDSRSHQYVTSPGRYEVWVGDNVNDTTWHGTHHV